HRDGARPGMETERSGRRPMMARYSLMQRVTWALTGSATLFVVVLCAVFYLSFGQMEDDLVNAVLATEVEHMLGRLEQGQTIPTQQSQTELGAQLQTWLIDGRGDEALLPAPLRGIGLGTHRSEERRVGKEGRAGCRREWPTKRVRARRRVHGGGRSGASDEPIRRYGG